MDVGHIPVPNFAMWLMVIYYFLDIVTTGKHKDRAISGTGSMVWCIQNCQDSILKYANFVTTFECCHIQKYLKKWTDCKFFFDHFENPSLSILYYFFKLLALLKS